jgi:hypothetical protein
MQISRRRLLMLLGSAGFLSASPRLVTGAEPGARALFVLVEGITPEVPAAHLRSLLEPFAQAFIPVGLGLAPGARGFGADMGQLLRDLFHELPELFEPVADIAGLAATEPYFQMRNASRALDEIEAALGVRTGIVSVATSAPPRPANLDALRAVGLRNVMATTAQAQPLVSLPCDGGALCLQGSVRLSLETGGATLGERLRADFGGVGILGVLSADDLAASTPATIFASAEAMVAEIVRAVQRGSAFAVAPREHLAWFVGTQARTVALRLELPPEGDVEAGQAYLALRAALRDAGIPFSASGRAALLDDDGCLDLGRDDVDAGWIAARSAAGIAVCAVGAVDEARAHDLAATGLVLLVEPGEAGATRLDPNGVLRWPESYDPMRIRGGTRGADVVLSLTRDAYRDPAWRASALDALIRLRQDGRATLRSLSSLASDLVPKDPVFAILRETRRDLRDAGPTAPETADEHDLLLGDARAAWSYVEEWTEPATGLCPATVHRAAGGTYKHQMLTMWDFGSLIHASISAHELGFLTDDTFLARTERLLRALPASSIRAHVLPNELIATDRVGPLSQDFNACDTGRLVGALVDLDRYPLSRGIARPVLDRWDLDAIILDRRPHSISGGRLVDAFISHCTAYLARNFREIGIDVASPYAVDTGGSETDWQMRLLYAASRLGAYGAEPLLLEAIERGPTREGDLLADVLWTEQERAYARTGLLHCVSEAPLDRAPWFAYAGLRLNDDRTRWEVRANSPDPRFATDAFQRESLLVNTKGAFLWAAVRPGEHASRLVSHVRTHANLDRGGFAPGVFVQGARRMEGYADINTNGVVLEAVAYILRGRRPRDTSVPRQ